MNLFILDATLDDLPLIVTCRLEYLKAIYPKTMASLAERSLPAFRNQLVAYYRKSISEGRHASCIAFSEEKPIGFGTLTVEPEEPTPCNPIGYRGHISSIYVREEYRHHGIGGKILDHMLDVAKKKKIRCVYLETNLVDSPLYSEAGFVKSVETLVFNKNRIHLVK